MIINPERSIRWLLLVLASLFVLTSALTLKTVPVRQSFEKAYAYFLSPDTETVSGAVRFFENLNSFETNSFEHEEGLFSFEYRNNLAIKKNRNLYYAESLIESAVVFQIFENRKEFAFSPGDFYCVRYAGSDTVFQGREVCFSKTAPGASVINLEIFGTPGRFFKQKISFFSIKNLADPKSFDRFDFFSRVEALRFVLKLRYPRADFSPYADDCFFDIKEDHSDSGLLCFAKQKNFAVGIHGNFCPEQSVNLAGFLKWLFLAFDVKDFSFDESRLDPALFENMTAAHTAYPLLAKGYYEGLFENLNNQTLWPNRTIYKGEAIEIAHRFMEWKEKKVIRNYSPLSDTQKAVSSPAVYFKSPFKAFAFKEDADAAKDSSTEKLDLKSLISTEQGIEIYQKTRGGIYEYLHTLVNTSLNDIDTVLSSFDTERLKGRLFVRFKNGTELAYKRSVAKDQFVFLKDGLTEDGLRPVLAKLERAHLLPNKAAGLTAAQAPAMYFYLNPEDMESLFLERTGDRRYPAYLEMVYPDGDTVGRSVLIKTRGNANKGYIKSSFTVESFDDFSQHFGFEGDEFLEGGDEFKLRSFINEETMIREKLFYETFKRLGYIAPDFFETVVEINGVPLGFYQSTEPVKDRFFKRRNLKTEDYFYAQNLNSAYNTNLAYYASDEITLSQYKAKGDAQKLLSLIKALDREDPGLIQTINSKNIFDYALLTYLFQAGDSLTHNYYVYWDRSTEQWNIFPWDADDTLESVSPPKKTDFLTFARRSEETYNNLIRYLFNQLSQSQFNRYYEEFRARWNQAMNITSLIDRYATQYKDYFEYDNLLWNGKYLERRRYVFDTPGAIEELKRKAEELKKL